jgi:hypothetical protein
MNNNPVSMDYGKILSAKRGHVPHHLNDAIRAGERLLILARASW